jgi:predicted hydrolase (HD superfamily)
MIAAMTIDEARALMHEWTAGEALRIHMEAVAACMGAYAGRLEPDQKDRWIIAGLLHDFDYEKHPSKEEHPFIGVKHLRERAGRCQPGLPGAATLPRPPGEGSGVRAVPGASSALSTQHSGLLPGAGVDEEVISAILGHAECSGVPRLTPMQKALFAVDELAGFIVACCKVRPNGIGDLEAKSVKKKLKDKAFAANVSREDIATGLAELGPVAGVDEMQHIQVCIEAIRAERARLNV